MNKQVIRVSLAIAAICVALLAGFGTGNAVFAAGVGTGVYAAARALLARWGI